MAKTKAKWDKPRKCALCPAEYTPTSPSQKFCLACREQARLAIGRRYRASARGKARQRRRNSSQRGRRALHRYLRRKRAGSQKARQIRSHYAKAYRERKKAKDAALHDWLVTVMESQLGSGDSAQPVA